MVENEDFNRKTYILFWLFGLLNNVLYVVILSAAADIVGPALPKSLVLLADILPSLTIKILAPFFIDRIPYGARIVGLIICSFIGMFLVSFKYLGVCLTGVFLASLSSGFGEITFLQLTHYHGKSALNGWSSGTGGAGLLGSGIYMGLTSILKLPVRIALLLFSILPFGFTLYYQLGSSVRGYDLISHDNEFENAVDESLPSNTQIFATNHDHVGGRRNTSANFESEVSFELDQGQVVVQDSTNSFKTENSLSSRLMQHLRNTEYELRRLILPYMLPLTVVYFFEYLMNQAILPTVLFPLNGKHTPFFFHKFRDFYVTYGTLYQFGVFVSRTWGHKFRIKNLYSLAILQGLNVVFVICQSTLFFIHNPWPIFTLILYEGLLGGSSYVNTFLNILEEVDQDKREFAMGAVSIADSFGVFVAAMVGLALEPALCKYQVADGREWCTLT